MDDELTPERVIEMGKMWGDDMLDMMPVEEVLSRFHPQELLAGLQPEERLAGLQPEERLAGLKREEIEEIEAYLQRLKQQPISEVEQAMKILIATGVVTPPPGESEVAPLSEVRRRKSADRLGKAASKPVSEMIIEDRIR